MANSKDEKSNTQQPDEPKSEKALSGTHYAEGKVTPEQEALGAQLDSPDNNPKDSDEEI